MPGDDVLWLQREGRSLIGLAARFGVSLSAAGSRREFLSRAIVTAGASDHNDHRGGVITLMVDDAICTGGLLVPWTMLKFRE